ncbi:MAG: N-acetyl sugar amidotransferase [Bacteroidota bacterium]|nr:N-acetyl sugar amidotransferase [Bacteroidota bacterium]MDP4215104.1 N-acetyl sugar amidotransferase [Bacteroidota bacterium]MDP4248101.1 N-acetyl sugar amidotransferase [Bacteroidota bacterium]MDP4254776.1 N-acetyl sugar amidotransferase [Bacteroidota bacterium]MDP4258036.1 N-acetyl sugar amidotransferase [Bacteroidota bacterium]
MVLSEKDNAYRQCSRTVMDNIADPDITFDAEGVCNYYHEYRTAAAEGLFTGKAGEEKLAQLADKIKKDGKGKPYDCLIGLSGGVDSTYVALLVKQLGLRPLAVHLDNGWNSELAVKNVENIITRLGFDLFTLVVNWQEFRDIQLSYLKASVVDIEVVSDHAIFATMYKLAKEHRTGYIISGTNIVTEQIMPPSWLYRKMDYANLKDIHDRYGKVKLKTYPYMDFRKYVYYSAVLRLSPVSILNYVPYNKAQVKETITRELGWRDYGGKHYESLFTKFYQAYILPQKFHIDKRKAHLSNLICSGQLTRESALEELARPLYDPSELKTDKEYVEKKLGLTDEEFAAIMALPVRRHEDFKTDRRIKDAYMNFLHRTAPIRRAVKKIVSK